MRTGISSGTEGGNQQKSFEGGIFKKIFIFLSKHVLKHTNKFGISK
jgi:hypothetical protein